MLYYFLIVLFLNYCQCDLYESLNMGFDVTNVNSEYKCPSIKKVKESLISCEKELETLEKSKIYNSTSLKIYFQRHIRFLLNQIDFQLNSKNLKLSLRLDIDVSKDEIKSLQLFTQDKLDNLAEVDHALNKIFNKLSVIEKEFKESYEDEQYMMFQDFEMLKQYILGLFIFTAIAIFYYIFFNKIPLWRSILILLLLSITWHWYHLYMKALSRKQQVLSKELPIECHPEKLAFTSRLYYSIFSSSRDECTEYYEALNISPFVEVSPTMAISETITKFIVLPFEALGKNLGKFFNALILEIPWYWVPIVTLCLFFFLIFVTLMLCGYRIKGLFWSIEKDTPNNFPIKTDPRFVSSDCDNNKLNYAIENLVRKKRKLPRLTINKKGQCAPIKKSKIPAIKYSN